MKRITTLGPIPLLLASLFLFLFIFPWSLVLSQSEGSAYPFLINCEIEFTRLHCSQDGEYGSAEPYLWVAYFKIDGMKLRMNIDFTNNMIGRFQRAEGVTDYVEVIRMGSSDQVGHGNIGGGIDDGEDRSLDRRYNGDRPFHYRFGDLVPIPVDKTTSSGTGSTNSNAPGFIGCVAILLESDQTPNSAVITGYYAMIDALKEGLNDLIANFEFDYAQYLEDLWSGEEPDITIPEEAINSLKRKVGDEVTRAIKDHVMENSSIWNIILAAADSDEKLGTGIFYWSTAELQEPPVTKAFESDVWYPKTLNPLGVPRYIHHGVWQIFGTVKAEKMESIPIPPGGCCRR